MKTNDKIVQLYYSDEKGALVEVKLDDETVWLTQAQMVELFDSSKANISEHISHILNSGELSEKSTVRKFRTVQKEGNRDVERDRLHYNLDMIISVGYRVNTKKGIVFRQWATKVLKEYLVHGYALNEKRLQENSQKFDELKKLVQLQGEVVSSSQIDFIVYLITSTKKSIAITGK